MKFIWIQQLWLFNVICLHNSVSKLAKLLNPCKVKIVLPVWLDLLLHHKTQSKMKKTNLLLLSVMLITLAISGCKGGKKDKEQTRKYNRIKNERDQLKKKIETKKREASQISEQALREVSLCTERCEYALAATKRITNIAKTALATYASTNIAYRSDGQCPPYLLEVPEIFFNN